MAAVILCSAIPMPTLQRHPVLAAALAPIVPARFLLRA